ncbi:MAG: hypothetical protein AABY22_02405 [Nanoarchaeota archaeon]
MEGYQFIDKIGIEIEGGWVRPKPLVEEISLKQKFEISNYIGELISKPFDNLEELFTYMEVNWPDEVTKDCGYHIHISLVNVMYYIKCMNNQFNDDFMKDFEKWGKNFPCMNPFFWERLALKNPHCNKKFNPENQVFQKVKDHSRESIRRTLVNFSWGLHKTIECRLLPTFREFKTAKSATKTFINFVENYLTKNSIKELDEIQDNLEEEINIKREIYTSKPFNYFR